MAIPSSSYTNLRDKHGDQTVQLLDTISAGTPLVAAEAHIGETGGWSDLLVVTPTIAAAAFSANDFVGGKNTLTNAVRVAAGKGQINSLKLVDKSIQKANLLIFIFGADLAGTYADNAAESVTAADWLNWIGTIEVQASDYKQMNNAALVDFAGMGIDTKAASGRNLYALIVTTGTPTYGANALQLTFGVGDK